MCCTVCLYRVSLWQPIGATLGIGLPPLDRRKAMPGGTVNLKELEVILASSDVGGIQEWLEGLTQSDLKRVASCLPPTSRSPVAKSSALRASSLEHDPPPREGSL